MREGIWREVDLQIKIRKNISRFGAGNGDRWPVRRGVMYENAVGVVAVLPSRL